MAPHLTRRALPHPKRLADRRLPATMLIVDIDQILAQPFHHIARGCRLRAFRSADGSYVLKTLTTSDEIVEWCASDRLRHTDLPWAANLGETDAERCRAIQAEGLHSAALAWAQLRAETAMIHLQSQPSGEDRTPVNRGPSFPPFASGREPFLLQRHADLVGPLLAAQRVAGDATGSRRIVDDLIGLMLTFAARGIASETLNFLNNCGYVDGRMVQIDVGEFVASRDRVLEHARTRRILTRKSFHRLRESDPALADYFTSRIAERLTPAAIEALWAHAAPLAATPK